jgi:hypothetical protein
LEKSYNKNDGGRVLRDYSKSRMVDGGGGKKKPAVYI